MKITLNVPEAWVEKVSNPENLKEVSKGMADNPMALMSLIMTLPILSVEKEREATINFEDFFNWRTSSDKCTNKGATVCATISELAIYLAFADVVKKEQQEKKEQKIQESISSIGSQSSYQSGIQDKGMTFNTEDYGVL